jgi:hypothetical protein
MGSGAINTIFIASYENSAGLLRIGGNAISWIGDTYLHTDEVTNHIASEIYTKFNNDIPVDMVGLAYSGTGNPLLQMLNKNHDIDMKSVVLVGAPLKYGMQITNPNIENVISIEGGSDLVVSLCGGYFWSLADSPEPLNLYRVVLKGIDHFSYTYDPSNQNHDPKTEQAAKFATYIATIANDQANLEHFLRITSGITYNPGSKIYEVNLDEVTYEK